MTYIDSRFPMTEIVRAKVFWSGGSQAVRLPKEVRFSGTEVTIRRKGRALVLEPVAEGDDWDGFWDSLPRLKEPVRRWPAQKLEKRASF
jgi:virulence-associated protein VagC